MQARYDTSEARLACRCSTLAGRRSTLMCRRSTLADMLPGSINRLPVLPPAPRPSTSANPPPTSCL
eukprot:2163494-Rhodomonas_salina.1